MPHSTKTKNGFVPVSRIPPENNLSKEVACMIGNSRETPQDPKFFEILKGNMLRKAIFCKLINNGSVTILYFL
jgi:hypothetical protein